MKVQTVGILPSEQLKQKGNISLTPELLAATGARYSRNNEGLESIVSKIDWDHTDRSVDGIFKMVDYGHASIADMSPVPMFIDSISLYAAYYIWSISPTASGQESSTRYIKIKEVIPASMAQIPIREYKKHVTKTFDLYQKALSLWTQASLKDPSIMHIPKSVLEDTSEKGQKKLERMRRNFAFDRARVFLPACTSTNMMLIMSARSWVELISHLLSHPLYELQQIGEKVKSELDLVTPRLTKHAVAKPETKLQIQNDFEALKSLKIDNFENDGASLSVTTPYQKKAIYASAQNRTNRYSIFGYAIRQSLVRFGWKQITFAELRDLNRHRTGNKYVQFLPRTFYNAADQSPSKTVIKSLVSLSKYPNFLIRQTTHMIKKNNFSYVYFTLLGHTMKFEHVTTLDKFLYEAELRTGTGSHYRYAMHLKNTLACLYKQYPGLKKYILEGSAEPE